MAKPQASEIRCHETGLVLVPHGSIQPDTSLLWSDVNTVIAYKRDIYVYDLICLGFVTPEGTIEVHEEMQGWSTLIEQLPSVLPGMPPPVDWRERVAKPPFAPSVTTLFKRESLESNRRLTV